MTDGLEAHYSAFRFRMDCARQEMRRAVLRSFEHIGVEQRMTLLLHWPRAERTAQLPQLRHLTLYRVPREQYCTHFYFGFLCHYAKHHHRARNEATQKKAVPPPEPLVRLLNWSSEAIPAGLQSAEALAPTDIVEEGCAYQHWGPRCVDRLGYKLSFTLRRPRLSMRYVAHTRVRLYDGEPVRLVASNCCVVLSGADAARFHGLTLRLPNQSCEVELPLSAFRSDAQGRRTLDLTMLSGADQLCFLDTQGSPLTLVFDCEQDELRGTLRLYGGSGETRCSLDIGACELEYWSAGDESATSPAPIRYSVQLPPQTLCPPLHQHQWWQSASTCELCARAQEAGQLLQLVQQIRVQWPDSGAGGQDAVPSVPDFYVQDEQLVVVPGLPPNDWWTLYWRQRALSHACLSTSGELVFRVILGADMLQQQQPQQQYVYYQ